MRAWSAGRPLGESRQRLPKNARFPKPQGQGLTVLPSSATFWGALRPFPVALKEIGGTRT
jgi:hypothetical protein